MTSTLLVASAAAPSVQSSMILKLTLRPAFSKIDPAAVSSPPLATRPAAQPTQMFTRTRTWLQLESEAAATGKGLEVSTLSTLSRPEREPNHFRKSTIPYRSRL